MSGYKVARENVIQFPRCWARILTTVMMRVGKIRLIMNPNKAVDRLSVLLVFDGKIKFS
jgi:hypothetical protein